MAQSHNHPLCNLAFTDAALWPRGPKVQSSVIEALLACQLMADTSNQSWKSYYLPMTGDAVSCNEWKICLRIIQCYGKNLRAIPKQFRELYKDWAFYAKGRGSRSHLCTIPLLGKVLWVCKIHSRKWRLSLISPRINGKKQVMAALCSALHLPGHRLVICWVSSLFPHGPGWLETLVIFAYDIFSRIWLFVLFKIWFSAYPHSAILNISVQNDVS